MSYQEGKLYDTITIGQPTSLLEFNSIILVPNMITHEECQHLVLEVERTHAAECLQNRALDEGMERYMISELSVNTQALFEKVLRDRLLPFITTDLPAEIEDNIWALSMVFDRDSRGSLRE